MDKGSDVKSVSHEGLGRGEIAYTGLQRNEMLVGCFSLLFLR